VLTAMKVFALVLGLAVTGVLGSGVAGDAGFPEGDVRGDEEITEAVFEEALRCGDGDGCRYVAIGLFLRWGLLPPVRNGTGGGNRSAVDLPSEEAREEMLDRDLPVIRWDGFVQVTRGGARLVRTVEFERGDLVYPRNNRLTVEWRSATQPHWDGLILLLVVPRQTDPVPHVTIHTEPWSHVFDAPDLIGLHRRFPVTRLGHEIEINGFRVERDMDRGGDVAVFAFGVRWGFLDGRNCTRGGSVGAEALPSTEDIDSDRCPAVRWDGFLATTKGGVRLVQPLLFERGDLVYPQNNRLVLEWRSATQPHWDGILAVVAVPLGEVPQAHVTFHTDPWSHIFELRELVGGSLRVTVDRLGHEVEIRSDLVRP